MDPKNHPSNQLTTEELETLLSILQTRFEKNPIRHPGLSWEFVAARLEAHPDKCISLFAMERNGGEPDVVGFDPSSDEITFFDCSAETPAGRRNLCYDLQALEARKEHKPSHSAQGMADEMGIHLLTEAEYRRLQEIGRFDTKTSSWLETPAEIRKHGGAIFGDRRYDHVFIYHNGADSYYGVRGFRGSLRV